MAINNPYIPGDPYSYDLKWIVAKVKEILQLLGTLDETIEKKIFEGFVEHSIVQFHNVPEMLAADLKDGSIVFTLGYHEAGDLGSLFYLIKDFNPGQCSLDYFLTMDNNAQIAIPVVVTPYVLPEMFGAYGDGTEDDSDAMDICLTKYKTVYLGDKTYKITRSMSVRSGMTLQGLSKNSAILATDGKFGAVASITEEDISDFVMRDFMLMVPDDYTGNAMLFDADSSYHDVYRFSVENVVVRHETLNPQPVTTNNGVGIHMSGALSGLFSGVYLHDFDKAVKVEYVTGRTTGANAITFVGGEIQSCNDGLSVAGLRNASFVNFTMEGCRNYAAHLRGGCEGVSFINNYLEGNGVYDFVLDQTFLNEVNKSITFDGIVGRASSSSAAMFKFVSVVNASIRNCSSRGGNAYPYFVENAAASPSDVIGEISGTTDAFDNQYAIAPFNTTLHPSATPLIDKMTMFMKPVDRDFFDNDNTDVVNTAGTETTLRTITIPANFMTRFGGVVEILIAGDFTNSSSNSKAFKFNINGSTVKTSTTTQASGSWIAKIKLISNYDQTVRAIYEYSDQGMSDRTVAAQGNITGSNIVITYTGTCVDASMRARQSYWKNA